MIKFISASFANPTGSADTLTATAQTSRVSRGNHTTPTDGQNRKKTMHKPTARFNYYRRRLGLTLRQVSRLTGEPYGTVKNWSQGRNRCPRSVLRLMAAYRLMKKTPV
jgi:DNA-binding transcriptional regulator YiaG